MLPGVEVFCRMLIGRVVATAHVTTTQTQPQVDPPTAGAQTFLATLWCAWTHVADLIEMRTGWFWIMLSHAWCSEPLLRWPTTADRKLSTS